MVRIVNEKITVYVVDDSEEYIQLVEESLSNIPNLEIIERHMMARRRLKALLKRNQISFFGSGYSTKRRYCSSEELQKEEELHNSVIIMLTAIDKDNTYKRL